MSGADTTRAIRCAIHIHSDYDDGDRPLDYIANEALDNGVDALLLTDHHAAHAVRDGWEGYHGNLLLIVGAELSTRQHHLLVFGIHDRVKTQHLPTPEALALLDKLGTLVFAPHPQGFRRFGLLDLRRTWKDWDNPHFAGLEIWSYMHDWTRDIKLHRIPQMVREANAHISGPEPWILQEWDRLAEQRHVAGIGGIDNHARDLPLGLRHLFTWAKDGILPHRVCFSSFATYALCDNWEFEPPQDTLRLLHGLQRGHTWVCHDALANGRDFRFFAEHGTLRIPMGEEIPFAPGIRLHVQSPQEATLRLLCRGACIAETTGSALSVTAPHPGEYRVDAHLDGRPWIFSNHIYLRK